MKCMIMNRTFHITHDKNSVGGTSVSSASMKIQHIVVFQSKRRITVTITRICSKMAAAFRFYQLYILLGKPNNPSTSSVFDTKRCHNF